MSVKMAEQGHAGFVLGFIYDCFPPVLHIVLSSPSPSCPACRPRGLRPFPEVSSQDKGHSPLVRLPCITTTARSSPGTGNAPLPLPPTRIHPDYIVDSHSFVTSSELTPDPIYHGLAEEYPRPPVRNAVQVKMNISAEPAQAIL